MNTSKIAKLLREIADEIEGASNDEHKELKKPIQIQQIKTAREVIERSGYRLK